MRYVSEKDKKAVMASMRPIYQVNNEQQGMKDCWSLNRNGREISPELQVLAGQLGKLVCILEYDQVIRKVIYTTNPIEGVHRQIRKITKTKGAFSSEQALMKLMCLVIKDISKKMDNANP